MNITPRRVLGVIVILCSYICLYFGLLGELVFYEHYVTLNEKWFTDEPDRKIFDAVIEVAKVFGNEPIPVVPPVTRSLFGTVDGQWSMVRILLEKAADGSGSYLAPYTLIFFGAVFPAFKLLGLLYWALSPFGGNAAALNVATRLTRWTAVDAVAEAMIVALLLKGGVHAEHRLGYCTFIAYILLSAVGIWIIDDSSETRGFGLMPKVTLAASRGHFLPKLAPLVTAFIFLAFFGIGIAAFPLAEMSVPKGAIRSNLNMLIGKYQGALSLLGSSEEISELLDEVAESVPLPSGQGSVIEGMHTLLFSGHPYTVCGSLVLFIFVLLCPVIEMVTGTIVALRAADSTSFKKMPDVEADTDGMSVTSRRTDAVSWLWEASGDLAMLDVYCTGMYVAALVIAGIGDVLNAKLLRGFYFLVPAAITGIIHQVLCAHQAYAYEVQQMEAEAQKEKKIPEKVAPATNDPSKPFFVCCNRSPQSKSVAQILSPSRSQERELAGAVPATPQ